MSRLGFKSVVIHGDLCLGELDNVPVKYGNFKFPRNEIRIHHISPNSGRCHPLAVLQTIASASIVCKLEPAPNANLSSNPEESPLINLHAAMFYELKTAVVLLGNEEIHLVAMPSKQKRFPCFWCFSVPCGLFNSCLWMLNMRCLAIVFDLDETLIVANTMKSFEDRIEHLTSWITQESDPIRESGMTAEVKRYIEDRALLKQYAETDSIILEGGKAIESQLEEVPGLSDGHVRIERPVVRLPERNIVLTRINPENRDTSVLVRLRPAWQDLKNYLTAKGRKRFEVYVCTMAERDYALEMWRLLDPEAHLISSKQLLDRVVCVKSGSRKSLLNVFQDGNCHPKMAMVIDDQFKVWEEKDQPRVHVVPAFSPYYPPQAETANAVPVLCVARNVACNVRGGFFKEFDESLLRRISDVFHEDDVVNLPSAPDVSNYLISEDSSLTTNGHSNVPFPEGMNGAETAQNLLSLYTMTKNPIASILDSDKLTGPNYVDWLRNLKLVLDYEKLTYVLDKMPPKIVLEGSTPEEIITIEKWRDDNLKVRCYMLASMTNELHRQHEYMMHARDIHMHLQELYGEQLGTVKYNTSKELFQSRMREGSSVHDHVLKMIGLIEKLATFNVIIENDLAIDLILQSLADSFDQFVVNFHMRKMSCSLVELLNLLSAVEITSKKDKPVMLMGSSSKAKKGFQPKNKKPFGKISQKVIKKPKMKGPKTLVDGKEQSCFHCGKPGHWRRNCKEYIDQKRSETGDGKKHQT